MPLASNTLRVFLALLMAVPLGAGGICCCLTDGMAAEFLAEVKVPPAPKSPCCSVPEPVAAPLTPGACEQEGEDCECPALDDATLSARSSVGAIAAAHALAAIPAPEAEPVPVTAPDAPPAPPAPPPPKVPVYLAHSVFRS